MGNTVFFSAKKLMERTYLLGLFELSMIFQDFRAVQTDESTLLEDKKWLQDPSHSS